MMGYCPGWLTADSILTLAPEEHDLCHINKMRRQQAPSERHLNSHRLLYNKAIPRAYGVLQTIPSFLKLSFNLQ